MTGPIDPHNPTARPLAKPVPADAAAIDHAAAVLRGGGLVALPTETVYGLGANALDATAAAKIFEAKGRPSFDPLIVHVAEPGEAWRLAGEVPDLARRLADAFWPGPMTLVLEKATGESGIPDLVTAGLSTVALRVPGHPIARQVIAAAGVPVAAPSANHFGGVSPTTAQHVATELGKAVDLILDGGPCETGVESTVVSLVTGQARVLRPGGVAIEQIEQVIGPIGIRPSTSQPGSAPASQPAPQAPGMLDRHYAPQTQLTLIDQLTPETIDEHHSAAGERGMGLLLMHNRPAVAEASEQASAVEVLSPTGDLREAAANLFAAMRRLDASGVGRILAERAPDEGLGRAINDRLLRAAR
jgi:L-threonylcarbamoyladenylate synthase